MNPCAAIRAAFWVAMAARQAFQRSGGRPAAARSWLIRPHCPVPIATCACAVDAGRGAGARVGAVTTGDCAEGVAAGDAIGCLWRAWDTFPMGGIAVD